jgi:hypothetical protein
MDAQIAALEAHRIVADLTADAFSQRAIECRYGSPLREMMEEISAAHRLTAHLIYSETKALTEK